jgi:hypothetical protein
MVPIENVQQLLEFRCSVELCASAQELTKSNSKPEQGTAEFIREFARHLMFHIFSLFYWDY